jgi:hypothetical protein
MNIDAIPDLNWKDQDRHRSIYDRLMNRGYKGHVVSIIEYNLGNVGGDIKWLRNRLQEVKKRINLSYRFEGTNEGSGAFQYKVTNKRGDTKIKTMDPIQLAHKSQLI